MKKIYFLGLFSLLWFSKSGYAQCTGGVSGGAITPAPTSAYQTMNCPSGDFYYTFVVPASCFPTYDFSFCSADGGNASFDTQITILDNTGVAVSGGYDDDFCSPRSHVTWTPTLAGTYRVHVNLYSCSATGSAATLAYKMTTPPNMSFVSSTVVQSSTAGSTKCDFDQDVICLQIVTSGSCNSFSLSSLQLGAGGSTSATLADVSSIHVYYTGTANAFNSTNEFVAGGTSPVGGSNTLNGSQVLVSGTNYFWITYDVNSAATTGNLIDASVTQFTVSGTNKIPTATNPAGTRAIAACSSYPATKALGLQHWVKSDVGVTGSSVSAWADQSSGTSITGNMAQATAASQPSLIASGVNFQPYIRFDGSNDILVSANTFSGNVMYSASNNTILMLKNIKSGLVDYKWETDPTNATRMGFELNGNTQRFDFVDDLTGKNAASATNIANKDVIVGGITDATNDNVKLNGNIDATNLHGGVTFSPSSATLKPLNIGANDLGNPLYCNVDIAEVMTFNVKLGSSELRRVESYLSIKYGITLGNNKGTGASMTYMGSDGANIWNNQTGYHNNVIGIGRDNAASNSGLNKLRSKSVISLNASADILTIANGANMGGTAFGTDKSFFITGNNAKILPATAASNADLPVGIVSRLTRVWKGQETGTIGTISLKFDISSVVGVGGIAGANNLADVRLLVDQDGIFASGTTIVSPSGYSNTVDTVVFQFDFTAGTGFYYTLGSVNLSTAPLPITLLDFTSECTSNGIAINWTTATETNNDHFELERSMDGLYYSIVTSIQGHGTTGLQNKYSYLDYNVSDNIIYYYRLKQVDYSSAFMYYNITTNADISCNTKGIDVIVFPNPANDQLFVKVTNENVFTIELINDCGQLVYTSLENITNQNLINIQMSDYANGIYALRIITKNKTIVKKVTISH
jgi:hypothetical protein